MQNKLRIARLKHVPEIWYPDTSTEHYDSSRHHARIPVASSYFSEDRGSHFRE